MAETLTDTAIINRALARIGAGAILARDEDTEVAGQVAAVYDDVVEAAFAAYAWRWARATRKLDKLVVNDTLGFSAAFGFPADALGQPQALFADPRNLDNPVRSFRVEQRTVYADAFNLWGSFTLRHAPNLWPPLFRTAVTQWLAAELCVPITHDKDLAAQLLAGAVGTPSEGGRGGTVGRAIAVDHATSGGPAPLLAADPLTSARYGGPWHGDF